MSIGRHTRLKYAYITELCITVHDWVHMVKLHEYINARYYIHPTSNPGKMYSIIDYSQSW